MASLLTTPTEILEEIALCAIEDRPDGPPHELFALSLTSRSISRRLSFDTASNLHGRIFRAKFDIASPVRRFQNDSLLPVDLKKELRRRFTVLGYCRLGLHMTDAQLIEVFEIAYTLLLEDDGRNMRQLQWAGVHDLAAAFLRERVFDGSTEGDKWPVDSAKNGLAISVFWLLSSRASAEHETPDIHDLRRKTFGFIALAAFRFPFAEAEHQFDGSEVEVRGGKETDYFGRRVIFRAPSAVLYAMMSHFARGEVKPLAIPGHLPETRQSAIAVGWEGITKADIAHANENCHTLYVEGYPSSKSSIHDRDWARAFELPTGVPPQCGLYAPGVLTGDWRGWTMSSDHDGYKSAMVDTGFSMDLPCLSRSPLYFSLREHHCRTPRLPAPLDQEDRGFVNAWLPSGFRWVETDDGIQVSDNRGSFSAFYDTYRPENTRNATRDHYAGAIDVIITGETGEAPGAAWGRYKFIGRVRPSDGLVVMLAEPFNPAHALGRWIYRGYVLSSQNFVGRWRYASSNRIDVADWEAMFSVSKTATP
ncbi:hypothetical protein PLICRDRAFT_174867 [Plicaturopsis crispa FD-325 SS-3]|nr:hypothetical protein PLICRDRAFT_174867 [Plicaturopsis crispa FD-325 SS-3]